MSAEVVRVIPIEPRYQIEERSIEVFFKDGKLVYAPKGEDREPPWEDDVGPFDVKVPQGHIGLILIQLHDTDFGPMDIKIQKPHNAFHLTQLSDFSFLIMDNNYLEAYHGADLEFDIMVSGQTADPRVVNE